MQTLLLGTAQWGLDYGATNADGRITDPVLGALIETATEYGITYLDTAAAYGDAESRIADVAGSFEVQTKVSASGLDARGVLHALEAGLDRLGREAVGGVLIHDWPSLDAASRREAATGLQQARSDGLAVRIGVSAYEAADLKSALREFSDLDVVQVPVSVLDQRLESDSAVATLRKAGARVQARSVLLQGVALAPASGGPLATHPSVRALAQTADELGVSPLHLCLAYVRTRPWIDEVVIAATNPTELSGIIESYELPGPETDWDHLASTDVDLIDPRRWTTAG